ncbi:MAG: hypothetical protein JJU48_05490 [Methylophaga sp.]|nr:hypothetical protein [Methylophaga sp.]
MMNNKDDPLAFENVIPDASGRFRLVRISFPYDLDHSVYERFTEVFEIIGWKYIDWIMVPVIIGYDAEDDPWSIAKTGALLNTQTGELSLVTNPQRRFESMDKYLDVVTQSWSAHYKIVPSAGISPHPRP